MARFDHETRVTGVDSDTGTLSASFATSVPSP